MPGVIFAGTGGSADAACHHSCSLLAPGFLQLFEGLDGLRDVRVTIPERTQLFADGKYIPCWSGGLGASRQSIGLLNPAFASHDSSLRFRAGTRYRARSDFRVRNCLTSVPVFALRWIRANARWAEGAR